MKPQKTIGLYSKLLWGIFLVFLASANAGAQTKKISGVVLSQPQGTPAAGATVAVKNTSRATTTDSTGAFTIEAAAGEILLVSRVGFLSREVTVENATTMEIRLTEADGTLSDVVVIGYGVQKKGL